MLAMRWWAASARGDRAREHRERGVTLIEAALVTPVFVVLLFGVLELGAAYKDKLTVTNATTSGARVGSAAADDAFSDFHILQAVGKAVTAAPAGSIQRVVVFKAEGPDGTPTAGCKAGTPSAGIAGTRLGACNVYTWASFSEARAKFGCQLAYNLDRYYCPTQRKVALSVLNGGPPDLVGVWVQMRHDYFTQIFDDSVMLTDQTVIAVEPRRL